MLAIQKSDTGYRVFGVAAEDTLLIGDGFIKAIPLNTRILLHVSGKCPHIIPVRKAEDERSDFALPEAQLYPLNSHEHVVAAIDLFGKHNWQASGHKQSAAKRILAAAKRHNIQVSGASEVARAARGE